MTQNIEQRTEQAVVKYEAASNIVDLLGNTDSEVMTPAGERESFPRLSRLFRSEHNLAQNDRWQDFQDRFSVAQQTVAWQPGMTISDPFQRYYVGEKGGLNYVEYLPDPNKIPFETGTDINEDLSKKLWLENGVPSISLVDRMNLKTSGAITERRFLSGKSDELIGEIADGFNGVMLKNMPDSSSESAWYLYDKNEPFGEILSFVDNNDYGTATLTTKNGSYEFVRPWVHAARELKDAKGWGYVADASIDSTDAIKRAVDYVDKYSELYIPGGGKFGVIPIRKEIKLKSDNTPITLEGAEAGFMPFDKINKLEISGFTVAGDGTSSSRQKLFALGAGVQIGTLIVAYNNVSQCTIGISAGFENGRTVKNAYIMYNKVSDIKGMNPGEGYGIHAANDRYNGSYGDLYIAYNVIDNCDRHSIYCARSNGFKVLFNTIKNHRKDVSTGDLRVALNLARSTDVVAAFNEFDNCHDGCIGIGADIVDGNVYDATNVKVFGNDIINPKVLAPIWVGYLEYNKGAIHSVSIYENTFHMSNNALPLIEMRMGRAVSFSRNKAYYRAVESNFHVMSLSAIGELGSELNYSDQWILRDNEIYIHNRAPGVNVYLYRFNRNTKIPTYILDNIATGYTHVASAYQHMAGSVIYMRGQKPEPESGIEPLEIENPSQQKVWRESSIQSPTPNHYLRPEFKGQEVYMTVSQTFWKAKGFELDDWIQI
ncbi:TPA: hypothetical protein NKV34_004495 [Vibrio parahaemolyticus]|nr:hypothetical protein [Vibrio parahaemolyticus]HCG8854710.1 hypothetical protein [Vibrio parahaemolyticus]HCH1245450.1 hypothetical protein [Vibrio parahaemolyticus]HCH3883771.1 hypothetical protein [Vibrio parahaemolyticus]HCH4057149.1 hypothetical protein [Vibrio parahaemolyticus]